MQCEVVFEGTEHGNPHKEFWLFIAFDPGVTTGIALVGSDGSVVETYAVRTVEEVEDQAVRLLERHPHARVGVEAPPQQGGNYRAHTRDVEAVLDRLFPNAEWIGPGEWKGHPSARPTSDLRGKTQHEKDATGLARFLRAKERHNAAGSGSAA